MSFTQRTCLLLWEKLFFLFKVHRKVNHREEFLKGLHRALSAQLFDEKLRPLFREKDRQGKAIHLFRADMVQNLS